MPSLVAPESSPALEVHPRARCRHVSRNGRACRYLAVSARQPFCKHHLPLGSPEHLSEQMFRVSHSFLTPDHVTNVLHFIFFALADGEISERRAGVFTYILQTILNSQRAHLQLQKLVADAERQGLDIDNPFDADAESASDSGPEPNKLTGNFPPARPAANPGPPTAVSAGASPCSGGSSDPCFSAESPTHDSAGGNFPAPQPASTEANSSPAPKSPPPKTPVLDLNHFYPRDPSLPRHLQDPDRFVPPFPSQAELDRRKAIFDRIHSFRRSRFAPPSSQ